jgi:hypothetical protein
MKRIDLRGCGIVASKDRRGWVDQAVVDLAEYVGGTVQKEPHSGEGTVVLVGRETVLAAAEAFPELSELGLDGLSDQGFALMTVRSGGSDIIVCSGGGSRGDAYAVIELIKAIDRSDAGCFVEEIDRREEPFFVRRGMYAHQHWAYAYPYALRTWEFDDWRRYIDLLAYMKINLFQIWSMAAILPSPLSDGDRAYLENYNRVVDYAKNRRGMEVFIGECANNVAEHDGGKAVAERDYFDVEVLKDPGDPKQFDEIMANRRSLYSVAGNADGYWIIDSDPGGWKGSPVSEFVDILAGSRKLIDELTDKGPNAKLVYWMWHGWGQGIPLSERVVKCGEAVEQIRDRLKEPWMLLACNETHLAQVAELSLIDKTIFFPYNTVEIEPSQPLTRLRFHELYDNLNTAVSMTGVRSVMGNAQTPFVQLPNIFCLAELAWNGLPGKSPDSRQILERLAHLMAPDIASELTDAWLALDETDPERVLEIAHRIDHLKAGRSGALGAKYGPGVERLLSDLARQLRVHAAARTLIAVLKESSDEDVAAAVGHYAKQWFEWQAAHGFEGRIGRTPDSVEIASLWSSKARPDLVLKPRLIAEGRPEKVVDVFLTMFKTKAADQAS